jgi:predicted transcriptional regulator
MNGMRRGRPKADPQRCSLLMQHVFQIVDDSGMTQRRVAERAGVGENTLCRWRSGRIAPTVGMIEAVLGAAGYRLTIERVN